jgi:hypothetical protein
VPGAAALVVGLVVAIADGDTLTVLNEDFQQVKIRLAEIDAPEKKQPFGSRSRQSLGELCHEKRAEVRVTTSTATSASSAACAAPAWMRTPHRSAGAWHGCTTATLRTRRYIACRMRRAVPGAACGAIGTRLLRGTGAASNPAPHGIFFGTICCCFCISSRS